MRYWRWTPLREFTDDGDFTEVALGAEWAVLGTTKRGGQGVAGSGPVQLGEEVWGQFQGGFNCYLGRVTAVQKDGRITLHYEDGTPRNPSNFQGLPPHLARLTCKLMYPESQSSISGDTETLEPDKVMVKINHTDSIDEGGEEEGWDEVPKASNMGLKRLEPPYCTSTAPSPAVIGTTTTQLLSADEARQASANQNP